MGIGVATAPLPHRRISRQFPLSSITAHLSLITYHWSRRPSSNKKAAHPLHAHWHRDERRYYALLPRFHPNWHGSRPYPLYMLTPGSGAPFAGLSFDGSHPPPIAEATDLCLSCRLLFSFNAKHREHGFTLYSICTNNYTSPCIVRQSARYFWE